MFTFANPLVINLKNYNEISGNNSLKIAEEARNVLLSNHKDIILAPPPSSIMALSKTKVPIVSQHVDDAPLGATTGFTIPEIVKSHGAIGSIINHSAHKIDVQKALELGAERVLISSGVVKSASLYNKILELSSVLK